MFYNSKDETMIKALIYSILWAGPANADSTDVQSQTCVIGQSYIPPQTIRQPHIIKTSAFNVVLWPSVLPILELEPWNLVCKKICVESKAVEITKYYKQVTIKSKSDLDVKWENVCN